MQILQMTVTLYLVMLACTIAWFTWRAIVNFSKDEKPSELSEPQCKRGKPCIHSKGRKRH